MRVRPGWGHVSVVTEAALRHQSRRFLAPAIAIVLGVAFAAVALTLNASLKASVLTGLTRPVREITRPSPVARRTPGR